MVTGKTRRFQGGEALSAPGALSRVPERNARRVSSPPLILAGAWRDGFPAVAEASRNSRIVSPGPIEERGCILAPKLNRNEIDWLQGLKNVRE